MIRIGQCSDTFLPVVDGVGRVVLAYAETLARLGQQVTVSAPMYDTGYRGGYPFELVDYCAFRVPKAPQYRTAAPLMDNHYKNRINMITLDIVHAHSPFVAGREALRLARRQNIPLVATFHSKYYDDFLKVTGSESVAKVVVAQIVRFYRKCDEVWAVSQSSAEVLRSYGYSGAIEVMPNGVAVRAVDSTRLAAVNERYALGEAPLLLFVGQMNWKKNILRILEASALLAKQGAVFRLLLAGQGPDEADIRTTIDTLGLAPKVQLIGHIGDMRDLDALYARAALFVFPSLYDNAPMVAREAAAMGTPSVMVAHSSAAEIIRDGENGYLCRDEAEDLARVISQVLADPQAAKQVGQQAAATIPVPWEGILQTALARYEALISQHALVPKQS